MGELFESMSGVDMLHVPYRGGGGALLGDLLGSQIQLTFIGMAAIAGYIRSGKLHALAVTSGMRLEAWPDIPAISEFVLGYEAVAREGLGAPSNTPSKIIDRLNEDVNSWLTDPKVRVPYRGAAPAVIDLLAGQVQLYFDPRSGRGH